MLKRAILSVLLFTLFGCMAGPDYRRPSQDIPDSWRFSETETRDAVNTAWWEQFNDPVLNDLIVIALKENKDLRIAAARVEEFMGRYISTRAPLFPQIGASASAGRERSTARGATPLPSTARNPAYQFNASLSASWEIDLWGKLRRATEAARADLLSTEEARKGVILTLVTSVAGAYVNLRDLESQLDVARNTAKTREDYFKIFTLRFNAGYVSDLELNQVKSQYEEALATIPSIEKSIEQQEDALNVLLGRNPGPIPRGKGIDELRMPAVPAGLPSDLLDRRPDIREAEQELIASNARVGVAKAQYFPSISLTGAFGWSSTELSNLFTGPAQVWNWAVPLTSPVFAGGSISGQVKTAEALQKQALLRYLQSVQNAFRDVEDALIDQKRSRERLDAQGQQVEALRTYSRVARLRYDNGYTSYIEVLDAERSLFDAELSYTQTKGTLFQALVDLYKAMGGGWIMAAEEINAGTGE